ncbi:MAG TPA: histidine phosphatase family protein [Micromonosporaceae bacterium]|nr:histidine phosphatase family protein [Micromonosporaceae bacterium]HCU48245.1 histidine phosphatase family protein [Micromonosporaceae bacterium]
MGRTLVLLRHAKADRPNGVPDVDRPLTERGHADSAAAGAWLIKHGYVPDLVLCSPSRRTRQTWHSVAVTLAHAGSPTVRYERAAYDGSVEDLVKLVQEIEPEFQMVMMIGHNPTISQLSELLDPAGEADSDGLRTCGIAVHEADVEWSAFDSAHITAVHTARVD